MSGPARGTLAWKLYVLGIVQMVLLGCAVVGVGSILREWRRPPPPPPAIGEVATELAPLTEHPADLAQKLIDLREARGVDLTVYDEAGRAIGSNVEPPIAPDAKRDPRTRLESIPIAVGARRGILVARHKRHDPPSPVAPLLTFFLSGLVIVGIGSVLTARWIVRPLEQLSRAARALGAGDLQARTALARSDELGEVGRAFDEMAGRIQTLLLAEKELLANVSHELRTPLARIRVALDLAAEGDVETARASLSEIGVDLSELEALIDDILTATRFEIASGRVGAPFEIHRKRVEPATIAARASERFHARHPQRRLDTDVETALPNVDADETLFRRVIDNLLENAHKYTPDPGHPITLRIGRDGPRVAFTIGDQGIGISDEDLPHVFTAFFRGDRSRARGTGGVGLGLTLAKRIVEAHDGTIDVQSRAGAGTSVKVSLPSA